MIIGVAATLFSQAARAGSFQAEFSLPLFGEYVTNPNMEPDNDAVVRRVRAVPEGGIAWTTERDTLYGRGGVIVERTDSQSLATDRTDPRGVVGWRRLLARGNVGLNVKYDETMMRAGETDEPGVHGADSKCTSQTGTALWEYQTTETASLNVSGTYRTARYERSGLGDFDLAAARVSFESAVSQRSVVYITVAGEQRNGLDAGAEDTEMHSANVGLRRKVGPRTGVVVEFGGFRRAPEEESGWLARAALDYKVPTGSASVAFARGATADTGLGFTTTDKVTGTLAFEVSETETIGVSIERRDMRSTVSEVFNGAAIQYARRLGQNVQVGASYRVRSRSIDNDNSADSRAVGVSITYVGSTH